MVIKLTRKWNDKYNRYGYGLDNKGNLYCKDLQTNTTLVCIDKYFKKKKQWYWVFLNPTTKNKHYVRR